MTDDHRLDTGRRIVTDGGSDTKTVQKTVTAKDVVTREIDDEEREVLRVPISSTRQDREGDAFSESALRERVGQIRDQQPLVFDDHGGGGLFSPGYSARETIGTQFDAEVEEGDDGHHTLFAFINPDHSHEEGSRMLSQVRDEKQAIKFSVGFRILETAEDLREDDRPDRANEVAGRLFTRADLMETSRVGIPANPDASASVAAKNGAGFSPYAAMNPAFAAANQMPQAAFSQDVDAKSDAPTDPLTQLRDEIAELRAAVDELREDDDDEDDDDEDDDDDDEEGDDDKGSCDVNADCPEGEVCRDGECVPADDDEDEESAELTALREEIADLRKSVSDGLGTPESADTDTTSKDALPDADEDDESTANRTQSDEPDYMTTR